MRASTYFACLLPLAILTCACTDDPFDTNASSADDDAVGADEDDEDEPGARPSALLDARAPQRLDASLGKEAGFGHDAAHDREGDGAALGGNRVDAPAGDAGALDARARRDGNAPAIDARDSAQEPNDEDASACSGCCADGFARGVPGETAERIASLTPSPEGVAVCPNGEVFVALDGIGEIWHVPLAGGRPERWASLGERRPAGLACDEHGRLFAAIFASPSGDPIPIEVLMVTGRDAAPVAMPQPSNGAALQGLNGIVAVAGIGVFASDQLANTIVHVRETAPGSFETKIVAQDVSLANGLAYRPATRELFAVASGAFTVFAFQVAADGALSARREVPVEGLLLFEDGIAVDAAGEIYVVDYLGGVVVRASDGHAVAEVPSPASLAFRGGTMFITSYNVLDQQADGALYAIELGVCGY